MPPLSKPEKPESIMQAGKLRALNRAGNPQSIRIGACNAHNNRPAFPTTVQHSDGAFVIEADVVSVVPCLPYSLGCNVPYRLLFYMQATQAVCGVVDTVWRICGGHGVGARSTCSVTSTITHDYAFERCHVLQDLTGAAYQALTSALQGFVTDEVTTLWL